MLSELTHVQSLDISKGALDKYWEYYVLENIKW